MTGITETFYSFVPAPSVPLDNLESNYEELIEKLKKHMKDDDKVQATFVLGEMKKILIDYMRRVEIKRESLKASEANAKYQPEDIIDNTEELKYLANKKTLLTKKITYRRKYENVKSTELFDKKQIMILYFVNAFLLLVLIYGCVLVFQEKTISVDILKKLVKSKNNKNNNRNNSRNNSSNNNNNSSS